jgi:hypothetical protein
MDTMVMMVVVVMILMMITTTKTVSIVTIYGLDSRGLILGRAQFFFCHNSQTGSGVHSTFYPMGTAFFGQG